MLSELLISSVGEVYERDVNFPIEKYLCFYFESREKRYPLNEATLGENILFREKSYQRDGVSSRFTQFFYFH